MLEPCMALNILIDKIKAQLETLEFADALAVIDVHCNYIDTKTVSFPFNAVSRVLDKAIIGEKRLTSCTRAMPEFIRNFIEEVKWKKKKY